MKILLSDIPDDGLDVTFEETFERESFTLLSPVRTLLHIDKVSSEVVVRGEVKALLELQCSRCLKSFPKQNDLTVNVVYHPVDELRGEDRHEIHDDELDTGFYRDDELDLRELIKEQVLLNIPLKPLCSEACKGICPRCGTDFNTDTCACGQETGDPRLGILKTLFDKGKE